MFGCPFVNQSTHIIGGFSVVVAQLSFRFPAGVARLPTSRRVYSTAKSGMLRIGGFDFGLCMHGAVSFDKKSCTNRPAHGVTWPFACRKLTASQELFAV